VLGLQLDRSQRKPARRLAPKIARLPSASVRLGALFRSIPRPIGLAIRRAPSFMAAFPRWMSVDGDAGNYADSRPTTPETQVHSNAESSRLKLWAPSQASCAGRAGSTTWSQWAKDFAGHGNGVERDKITVSHAPATVLGNFAPPKRAKARNGGPQGCGYVSGAADFPRKDAATCLLEARSKALRGKIELPPGDPEQTFRRAPRRVRRIAGGLKPHSTRAAPALCGSGRLSFWPPRADCLAVVPRAKRLASRSAAHHDPGRRPCRGGARTGRSGYVIDSG
jgi:hypothetical protein